MISYARSTVSRLTNAAKDAVHTLLIVPLEGYYAFYFFLSTIAATLIALLISAIAVVIITIISFFLSFSGTLQSLLEVLGDIIVICIFIAVPLSMGMIASELLRLPDGDLVLDPLDWDYPVVIPLVGFVAALPLFDFVWPPWTGVLDMIGAGVLAGVLLYRGALYPVLLDANSTRYGYDDAQRRIMDMVPDGTRVAPITFGLGITWLATALLVTVLQVVFSSLAAEFVDLIGIFPGLPPSSTGVLGVPMFLGAAMVAVYGLRELTVVIAGSRRKLRSYGRQAADLTRDVFKSTYRATVNILGILKSWLEYGLLLRP